MHVCSVQYAVESQIRLHGHDPAESLLIVSPREVCECLCACMYVPVFVCVCLCVSVCGVPMCMCKHACLCKVYARAYVCVCNVCIYAEVLIKHTMLSVLTEIILIVIVHIPL